MVRVQQNLLSPLCLWPDTHFRPNIDSTLEVSACIWQHGAPEHLGPKLVGYGFSQLVIANGPAASGLPGDLGGKNLLLLWGSLKIGMLLLIQPCLTLLPFRDLLGFANGPLDPRANF